MRVAVLGASGFIGRAVVAGLREDGLAVRAIGRRGGGLGSVASVTDAPGMEAVRIDYGHPGELAGAIAGAAWVVNCIANVHGADLGREAFRAVEVALTARIAGACRAAGAGLLQLSSVVAFGRDPVDHPIDERHVGRDLELVDAICLEREAAVRAALAGHRPGFAILRPVPVLGAGDKGSTLSRLAAARRGDGFPLVGDGAACSSFVDGRDLGRAFALALRCAEAVQGRTLIVGGFSASWAALLAAIDASDPAGRHPPLRLSPEEAAARLGRRTAELLAADRIFDDGAFRRATGYAPRHGLADAAGALAGAGAGAA